LILELQARVAKLEASQAQSLQPADPADLALLAVLAALDGAFTCAEALTLAGVSESRELARALLGADVETATQLGKCLQRLERAPAGDLRVVRVGRDRSGAWLWRIVAAEGGRG
jgi:hypothetical protein